MSKCCICLENISKKSFPYECSHKIHHECAKLWNKDCPLCKAKYKFNTPIRFELGFTYGYQVTIKKYAKLWDKSKCDPNYKKQHIVILEKPYGVMGYCSCKSIQAFNWLR